MIGPDAIVLIVEVNRLPVLTLTAPSESRTSQRLMRSKSTNPSSVTFSGPVSYTLNAPCVPSGAKNGGVRRGVKKLGTPNVIAAVALRELRKGRKGLKNARGVMGAIDETRFQNSRNRSTRRSDGLPAISAALMSAFGGVKRTSLRHSEISAYDPK